MMQTDTSRWYRHGRMALTLEPGDLFYLWRSSYVNCFCVFMSTEFGWVEWYEVDNYGRARLHGDFSGNIDIAIDEGRIVLL